MSLQLYVSLRDDECIRRFEMGPSSAKLSHKGEYPAKGGPVPMGLSPDSKHIYVGFRSKAPPGDGTPKKEFGLGSFDIDPGTGDLTAASRVQMPGEPCYVRTDAHGRFLLSSYFQAGHVAVNRIDPATGGVLADPIEWRPTNSGCHSIQIDPSNRYVFVPHVALGNDALTRLQPGRQKAANAVFQFKFDEVSGKLTSNDPMRCGPPEGEHLGPRHACFHPTRPWMYVCNEQLASITHYTLDRERGTLTFGKTVRNYPVEFDGKNTCADIQVHKSGRFLYAPNRGHDTVASYTIDQATGELTSTGYVRADPRPRAFMLDPTGNLLVAAGVETGNLNSYRIDQQTGKLTELESVRAGNTPMWVLIVELPGK